MFDHVSLYPVVLWGSTLVEEGGRIGARELLLMLPWQRRYTFLHRLCLSEVLLMKRA